MANALTNNATVLSRELEWFSDLLHDRLTDYFGKESFKRSELTVDIPVSSTDLSGPEKLSPHVCLENTVDVMLTR